MESMDTDSLKNTALAMKILPTRNIIADIDESSEGSHTCSQSANCINTDGSFECECTTGLSGDGQTCTIVCV